MNPQSLELNDICLPRPYDLSSPVAGSYSYPGKSTNFMGNVPVPSNTIQISMNRYISLGGIDLLCEKVGVRTGSGSCAGLSDAICTLQACNITKLINKGTKLNAMIFLRAAGALPNMSIFPSIRRYFETG